jgi:hypothetical protein
VLPLQCEWPAAAANDDGGWGFEDDDAGPGGLVFTSPTPLGELLAFMLFNVTGTTTLELGWLIPYEARDG